MPDDTLCAEIGRRLMLAHAAEADARRKRLAGEGDGGMARRYRSKPTVVEAMQYDGFNYRELMLWANGAVSRESPNSPVYVDTPEGTAHVFTGDWVIKAPDADVFWRCAEQRFAGSYEPAE